MIPDRCEQVGLTDLQVAQGIEEIDRLLVQTRAIFEKAPQLLSEVVGEQRKLQESRDDIGRYLNRVAAIAERAAVVDRACKECLGKVQDTSEQIESQIWEARQFFEVLQQAGGIEGLGVIRDRMRQVVEFHKEWDQHVAETLREAEQKLQEVHRLLHHLGGLDRVVRALDRLAGLEQRLVDQEKRLAEGEKKHSQHSALALFLAISALGFAFVVSIVFCFVFAKTGHPPR